MIIKILKHYPPKPFIFLFALAVSAFLIMPAEDANAQSYNLLVRVKGTLGNNNQVYVNLSGENITMPMQETTGPFGYACFRGLSAGTYTVTAGKTGYGFVPEFRQVSLGESSKQWTMVIFETASIYDIWGNSPHADYTAEAFVHWDEEDPPVIPTTCAKCHNTLGLLDYLGADGTQAGVVDNPVPAGEDADIENKVINCSACHNSTCSSSVTFPSKSVVRGLGAEGVCMQCHQGRSSTPQVNSAIESAVPEDEDTPDSDLRFQNIHYYAAAASLYGYEVHGGYEYESKIENGTYYDYKFQHVEGYDTCISCHDQHSLRVKVEYCSTCHINVTDVEDVKDIRMNGSLMDYDGDGNVAEGIFYEVDGLRQKLYQAIQQYADEVAGTKIAYDPNLYPYFFKDANGNGVADQDEGAYDAWTARLIKAAYNYQTSLKDPCIYVHNAKYIIELMYDSTEDLNERLSPPVSLAETSRIDEGHFDGSSEVFHHWDEDDGIVSSSCVKCHTAYGLPKVLKGETLEEGPFSNGFACSTCHDNVQTFTVYPAGDVTFPSGLTADLGDSSNLCMNCHQGRASKFTVDEAIAENPEGPYSFINIHYYAAAASFFGTNVKGGYEYNGKTYAGQNNFAAHGGALNTCVLCHMAEKPGNTTHTVNPLPAVNCQCHGVDDFGDLVIASSPDYDADGTKEPQEKEIEGLQEALYEQIQAYAQNVLQKPIVYDPVAYPYFFNDTNGNGVADPDEVNSGNRYQDLDAALLKAAYNYQFSRKEPCGYIHNSDYVAQLSVDSIGDLGGDTSKYIWR